MRLVKLNNNAVVMVMKEDSEIDGVEIIPNSEDASFEKHVPTYKFLDDESVEISVNHVMEEDHYIEWLLIEYYNEQVSFEGEYVNGKCKSGKGKKYNIYGDLIFEGEYINIVGYQDGMKAYAYCNKHGLWVNEEINK